MAERSSSAQKMAFKDTLLLSFMSLHTRAVELLYKCNITRVDVRYGCISAYCDYLRPNHSRADIQPYLTSTRVILLIYTSVLISLRVVKTPVLKQAVYMRMLTAKASDS